MIGHVSTGKSFTGLASYLEYGTGDTCSLERVKWIATRNLLAHDIRDAAREMQDEALLAERTKEPVYHVVVSFDPEDTVDRPLMLEVADRVLSDFELKQHQALIVAHGDTYYEHFHLMINRVSWVTTEAKKTPFDYHRLEKALRHLERELGLKETPGRHFRLDGQAYAGRKTGLRLGNDERKHAREALRHAQSWRSLEDRLARKGLSLFVARKALYITDGARTERAGALVRGGSLAKLEERFGQPFAEYRIPADVHDHTVSHRGESEGTLPGGHAAVDAKAVAVEVSHETARTMAEDYEDGSRPEARAGEGRGPAEQINNSFSQAPSVSSAGDERNRDAARDVLDDLHMHSEVVRLSTRRSNLIRQANALEADLVDLQERLEDLRAQDVQLDHYFRNIYPEAERARASFDADAVLVGAPEAAERLRTAPEAFGELRGGKVGPIVSAERQRALEAAQAASDLGRKHHLDLKQLSEETPHLERQAEYETSAHNGLTIGRQVEQRAGEGRGTMDPTFDRTSAFYRRLESIYQDPDGAYRAYEQLEERLGPERAARALTERPDALGPLRMAGGAYDEQVRRRVLQAAAAGVERNRDLRTGITEPLVYRHRINALEAELKRVQAEIGEINNHLAVLPSRRQLEHSISSKMAALSPKQRADVVKRVGEAGSSLAKTTANFAIRGAELAARTVTRQAMGRDVFER